MTSSSSPISGTSVPNSIAFAPMTLMPMTPAHHREVLALHDHVFGPGRFARTAFRLREQAAPLWDQSLVAYEDDALIGAVSLSRITVGDARGVLLGPLAVLATKRDLGVGKALLANSVAAAFASGEPYVLLVGDLPYYAAAGFKTVPFGSVDMPGPVDPSRLLVARNPHADFALAGPVAGCER